MKKPRISRLVLFFTFVMGYLFLVSGCGYTIQGKATLPFRTISIGRLVNKTFEPRLEDRMQLALVEELTRSGFIIDGSAGYSIEGTIKVFELRTLSAKAGIAEEYEVIIKGDFRLMDPSGKAKILRNRGAFIVSFQGADSLQGIMVSKEKATERALRELSSEMVASIIYQ